MTEVAVTAAETQRTNLDAWVERFNSWYTGLSFSKRILMTGALAAATVAGLSIGGIVGGTVLAGTMGLRVLVGAAAGMKTFDLIMNNSTSKYKSFYAYGAAIGMGFLAGRTVSMLFDGVAHAAESGNLFGSAAAKAWEHFHHISGFGHGELSLASLDHKIAELANNEAHARELLAKLSRVAGPNDPAVLKLQHAIDNYHSLHDQLLADRPDVEHLNAMQHSGAPAARVGQTEFAVRTKIDAIHTADGTTLDDADMAKVDADFKSTDALFHSAKPGTILYTDAKTGERFWYPLAGGEHPLHPGVKLPRLVNFGGSSSGLPLSTSRILYDFQQNLHERLSVQGVGSPIAGNNSNVAVTEGWNAGPGHGWTVHHESPGHVDGRCVDIAGNDTSPGGIAKWIAVADRTPGIDLHWEVKSMSPAELLKLKHEIALKLVKFGYPLGDANTPGTAEYLAEHHVRVIPWATGAHFHIETAGPAVYAPGYEPGTQMANK